MKGEMIGEYREVLFRGKSYQEVDKGTNHPRFPWCQNNPPCE